MHIQRIVLGASVALLMLFVAGSARADIIEIENPTGGCSNINAISCPGALDLTTLLAAGISVPSGTLKLLVKDTQGSFTINYTGTSGNVGSCQLNGATSSFFTSCVGVNGGGFSGFSNGHDRTTGNATGLVSPASITFTAAPGDCTPASPCFLTLGFVSWQGNGIANTVVAPEPASLTLLASSGLFALFALLRRRHTPINPAL